MQTGQDVLCEVLGVIFLECDRRQVPINQVVRGISYDLAYLQRPRNWLPWNEFQRLCDNLETFFDAETLFDIGRSTLEQPEYRWITRVALTLFSLEHFYRWATLSWGPASRNFPCLQMEVADIGPRQMSYWCRHRNGSALPPAFADIIRGSLAKIPVVFGMPQAVVEMEIHANELVGKIALPPPEPRTGWLLRSARRLYRSPRDIGSELIAAQGSLYESEQRFRSLFQAASDEIIVISTDGRVLDVNDQCCERLGFRRSDSIGFPYHRFAEPNRPVELTELAPGDPVTLEGTHRRADGSTYPLETRMVAVDSGGERIILAIARDISERRRAQELRQQILVRTLEAQERERHHLARELHDTTAQALTSILLDLNGVEHDLLDDPASSEPSVAERIERLRATTRDTLQELQQLVRGLRPTVLDDVGFSAALSRLAEDSAAAAGLRVDVEHGGEDLDQRLNANQAAALYRVVQEGLTNVVRHADARRVSVIVDDQNGGMRLIIEDDGVGFDPTLVDHKSFGLVGMRERVAIVGGKLIIESSPGRGTTLYVDLPLRNDLKTRQAVADC